MRPPWQTPPNPMSERPIHILSVNINRQSHMLAALLQDTLADILLIQEPWHGPINVNRSDTDPLGTETRGVTGNNMWTIYYPCLLPGDICKVVIYVRVALDRSITFLPQLDHPLASASSMVLDVITGDETLRLINVYHRVPREGGGHGLPHLLAYEPDPLIPTLLLGDFNTHSPAWSLPHSDPSPWESDLVDWFDEHGFFLLNPNGVPTWRSQRQDDSLRPSILDLALLNEVAAFSDQFTDISISFDIIPSDHAALSISWYPVLAIATQPPPELTGFAVDDDGRVAWEKFFMALPAPIISDIPSLQSAAQVLHEDIDRASASIFPKRKAPDPRGVRWWNSLCSAALSLVRISNGEERRRAVQELRNVLGQAKRDWAHDFLHQATTSHLWTAAKWRNGRSVTRIPPILSLTGLSHDPCHMAKAFQARFFSATPSPVLLSQPDDPNPLPP